MMSPRHAWIGVATLAMACGESAPTSGSATPARTTTSSPPAKSAASTPTASATLSATSSATVSAAASASAAPTGKAAECEQLHRVLGDHADALERIGRRTGDPFVPEMFAEYEAHGEALKKLELRDPDVRAYLQEYAAEVEKARKAAKGFGDPSTERKARGDFSDAALKATRIVLTRGLVTCKPDPN